jgi:hypothetical protein
MVENVTDTPLKTVLMARVLLKFAEWHGSHTNLKKIYKHIGALAAVSLHRCRDIGKALPGKKTVRRRMLAMLFS